MHNHGKIKDSARQNTHLHSVSPRLMSADTFFSFGLGVIANVIWGTTFLASSVALKSWPPITASAIRFLIAVPFLYLIGFLMGKRPKMPSSSSVWIGLIALSVFAYGLLYPLQLSGLTKIPTSMSAMIMFTSPLMVLLFSRILLQIKLSRPKIIALIFGSIGCVGLTLPGILRFGDVNFYEPFVEGILLTLTASLSLAISVVITKIISNKIDSFSMTFWSMCMGAAILVVAATVENGWNVPNLGTSASMIATIYLSIICSALAFLIWNYAISRSGDRLLSTTMHIKTPIAVSLGAALGLESISIPMILGLIAVSVAVYIYDLEEFHDLQLQAASIISDYKSGSNNRVLAQASQMVAHDLRMPLWNIEKLVDARNWDEFMSMKQAAKSSLGRIFTNIDAFRRMDIERIMRRTWQPFNMTDLESELQFRCSENDATFRFSVANNLWAHIDEQKIERAIGNLVSNAVDAGATSIAVTVRGSEDGTLTIDVDDNGPGVPAEILSKLFSMGITFGKATGTGLGLHYVQTVARGHGGDVSYARTADRSSFSIVIPHAAEFKGGERPLPPPEAVTAEPSLATKTLPEAMVIVSLTRPDIKSDWHSIAAALAPAKVSSDPLDMARAMLVYTDNIDILMMAMRAKVPAIKANGRDTIPMISRMLSTRITGIMLPSSDHISPLSESFIRPHI